jgi:hypothetical protein
MFVRVLIVISLFVSLSVAPMCGIGHAAQFIDDPTAGFKLVIKDPGPASAAKRKLKLRLDSNAFLRDGTDPTANGAVLQVFNSATGSDAMCWSLAAPFWSLKPATCAGGVACPASGICFEGRPCPNSYSLRYLDKAFTGGPVKTASESKHGSGRQLKLSAAGTVEPIDYTLDEPSQTAIGVVLSVPVGLRCTAGFGGQHFQCSSDADCSGDCQKPLVCSNDLVSCSMDSDCNYGQCNHIFPVFCDGGHESFVPCQSDADCMGTCGNKQFGSCMNHQAVVCEFDADCSFGSCQDTTHRLCANFSAPTTDKPGVFNARDAQPPATCPTPAPCP